MDEELTIYLPQGVDFKQVEDFNDEHMFFHDEEEDEETYAEEDTSEEDND